MAIPNNGFKQVAIGPLYAEKLVGLATWWTDPLHANSITRQKPPNWGSSLYISATSVPTVIDLGCYSFAFLE